jgi:hypothetical protein
MIEREYLVHAGCAFLLDPTARQGPLALARFRRAPPPTFRVPGSGQGGYLGNDRDQGDKHVQQVGVESAGLQALIRLSCLRDIVSQQAEGIMLGQGDTAGDPAASRLAARCDHRQPGQQDVQVGLFDLLPIGAVLGGAFVVADFEDAATIAYQDTAVSGQIIEDTSEADALAHTWDTLRLEALPRAASLSLIEEVATQ